MLKKIAALFLLFQFLSIQIVVGQNVDPDRAFGNRSKAKRLALVIGNSAYQNTAVLPNPKNDAEDMKAALESLGFEVIYGVDQSARQMKALIRKFGDRLAETKAVGLFYYAGHGIASGGENYLVPVDADIPAEDEIEDATVSLSFLMDKMTLAENDLNIVILDACRNNPFARKWSKVRDISTEGGLATISRAPTGTLIAYATQPGNTASDGTGRNGLYTQELLQQIKKPNLTIEDVFKKVRSEVRKKSKNVQIPWEASSIEGDFYFTSQNLFDNQNQQSEITQSAKNISSDIFISPVSKVEVIFRVFALESNNIETIRNRVSEETKKEGTSLWDENKYYYRRRNIGESICVGWRNLADNLLGWIFVTRTNRGDWFYKTTDNKWKKMERGKEYSGSWKIDKDYIRISIKLPILENGWDENDIMYKIGFEQLRF